MKTEPHSASADDRGRLTADLRSETRPAEVWGGAEYTCNRVRDRYFDQLHLSGHSERAGDLELFAELGIKALRCGVLWERHVLDQSWKREDRYLLRVKEAGMRPIAGLLHHGSGPEHTNLLDPELPEKLAAYAHSVAARYPWVEAYTPVNEPNTTGRFACRYGVWYPHHLSSTSFVQSLLFQTKAIVLSMSAIRSIRSDAQLIQTEDLGRYWSTSELADTCNLLNQRGWLGFDLLCGKVDRWHPLYSWLLRAGATAKQIMWFQDNPCPPDIVGVNYYVTSDRFLDHRIEFYPEHLRSAEGRFVDLEAVRVRGEGLQGFEPILREVQQRYTLPVAITEVHLGDTVEQQLAWAQQAWSAIARAQAAGVDCRAITFWALLGSYFWNQLVTIDNGHYEPGVFNLCSGEPQPTALANFVKQCAEAKAPTQASDDRTGWWQQDDRILYAFEEYAAA